MAQVPSRRWTVNKILSLARDISGTLTQADNFYELARLFYNSALSEIVSLLNSASDPAYYVREVITVANDFSYKLDVPNQGDVISAIDSVAHTVTFSTFTSINVGSLLVFDVYNGGVRVAGWIAKVTKVEGNGLGLTYSLIGGTEHTMIGSDAITMNIIKGMSDASFPITSLSFSVDRIITISDSLYGKVKEVGLDEFYSIGRADFLHTSYDDDIIWTLAGPDILFRTGKNCNPPGIKTVAYQRQPNYPVNYDDNEYMDLADKFAPLLIKRIYSFLLLHIKQALPPAIMNELTMDYNLISAHASAELANRLKSATQVAEKQNG